MPPRLRGTPVRRQHFGRDGSKFRASNNKDRNFSREALDELLTAIDATRKHISHQWMSRTCYGRAARRFNSSTKLNTTTRCTWPSLSPRDIRNRWPSGVTSN